MVYPQSVFSITRLNILSYALRSIPNFAISTSLQFTPTARHHDRHLARVPATARLRNTHFPSWSTIPQKFSRHALWNANWNAPVPAYIPRSNAGTWVPYSLASLTPSLPVEASSFLFWPLFSSSSVASVEAAELQAARGSWRCQGQRGWLLAAWLPGCCVACGRCDRLILLESACSSLSSFFSTFHDQWIK